MPRTNRNQEFRNGVLVSEQVTVVDDATIFREDAPQRVRTAYAALRQWSIDHTAHNTNWPTMSAGAKDTAARQLHARFAQVCDGLADLLIVLSTDR